MLWLYHVISYNIRLYDYIILYHIISYHIISYHIISYHIILYYYIILYPISPQPSGSGDAVRWSSPPRPHCLCSEMAGLGNFASQDFDYILSAHFLLKFCGDLRRLSFCNVNNLYCGDLRRRRIRAKIRLVKFPRRGCLPSMRWSSGSGSCPRSSAGSTGRSDSRPSPRSRRSAPRPSTKHNKQTHTHTNNTHT